MELVLYMILHYQLLHPVCYPHKTESSDSQVQYAYLEEMSQATNSPITRQQIKPITIKDLLDESFSSMDNSDSQGMFFRRVASYIAQYSLEE